MSPTKAAQTLAAQMQLGTSTRTPLTGEARVQHENGTAEDRASRATEKLAKADADIAAQAKRAKALTFAHDEYIHGSKLSEAVASAKRCLTVDEMSLRALLRNAWNDGFNAGYGAGQKAAD
ncbi:MAG: hypothetical protein V4662_13800 [Verrucomicrobiota bacterium]